MQEMSETADQIARLDFSARCRRSRCREMDDLGLSLNEMADRLQDYTGKLQTANAQLKQDIAEKERAEAARKRLIAGLSHDLKTPIALISGYAEGLSSGMARTPEQVAEYCGVIGEESDRMSALISRMLELSRLESGAVRPEPERFDLSELLDGLAGLFRVEIGKADIALEKDFPPECMVCTDAGAAEQVLTNYVQNAVAHMGEGRRLRIAIRDAGPRWRAEVFNSAPPFSEEERQSIWETFYRGEGSRRRKNGESGLGLAIVRGNMELLNLPYGVRNEADGVVFFAEFPKG